MTSGCGLSSFRDPDGSLFSVQNRILRRVSASAVPILREFLGSNTARDFVFARTLVKTLEIPGSDASALSLHQASGAESDNNSQIFEHERVWFPSFPYEWPPEMLFAAGELTLDLAGAALKEGFGLKDATPYNVLFCGPKPVFVDVLSFEKRDAGDPQWLPYAQFVRTFVLPLLMNTAFALPFDEIFLSNRDGLQPEEVYRHLSPLKRLRPPFLSTVSIPTWLTRRVNPDDKTLYAPKPSMDPEKARFILKRRLQSARKLLRRARSRDQRSSVWSSYLKNLSYTPEDFQEKAQVVTRYLSELKPKTVLDVGCNTGHFSEIAANSGASVVAIDLDPVSVGLTWQRATQKDLNILPLVVNLARPSPATGWRNAEYSSFLNRATGSFDMVMMLAVLHHLLVTERIPLSEVIDLAAELTTQHLIVEYVSKEDPLFQRLTRGRESLHAGFSQESFEAASRRRFSLIDKCQVKGNLRWLYLFRKTQN
jgi:SAM-dependent methyltransferase